MIERYSAAEIVNAPLDRIWALLSDFGNADVMKGFCRAIHVKGSGVGTIRTFELFDDAGGGAVSERIETFDEQSHYFSYRVFDIGPLPFADYVGSIRLALAGPDRCAVIYHAQFVPLGDSPGAAAAAILAQNFKFLVARLYELNSK